MGQPRTVRHGERERGDLRTQEAAGLPLGIVLVEQRMLVLLQILVLLVRLRVLLQQLGVEVQVEGDGGAHLAPQGGGDAAGGQLREVWEGHGPLS